MDTRNTNEIYVSDDFFAGADLIKFGRELNIPKAEQELNKKFKALVDELENIYNNNEWIKIENKKVYYVKSENIIIADSTRMYCSRDGFNYNFEGFSGTHMKQTQALRLFSNRKSTNPLICSDKIVNYNDNYTRTYWQHIACWNTDSNCEGYINFDGGIGTRSFSNCDSVCIPIFNLTSKSFLKNLVEFDLVPSDLSASGKQLLKDIKNSVISVDFDKNKAKLTDTTKEKILKGDLKELYSVSFKKDDIAKFNKEYCKTNTVHLTDEMLESFGKPFLECDKKRAEIEPYDLKCLTDVNGGHWDLWSENVPENKTQITVDTSLVGRNPEIDVHYDGLVGIDFGTKSTVVAYQDGSDKTYLRRIGIGKLSQKAVPKHYENPTVMEFINFEKFLEDYKASDGRPETLWETLTVSHTAQNNLNDSTDSEKFYSYFYDLKQWCGDTTSSRVLTIKDQNENTKILKSYLEIDVEDFDPIEIYAYYLGLFINNMRNGIYIDYIMSFPVTYEKAVREKIIESFSRGLKKSLPNDILKNEEIMSKFRVQCGASEPACYAICALQQFNIEPEEDDELFYGIFDFGGGTTDFDFGIWRFSDMSKPRERRYDYVINHFGAGGDQYLGGENLLELMSYEIFKANANKLLKNKDSNGYSFCKPAECDRFDGCEALLDDSQQAKRNMKQLMEKLRPLMENLKTSDEGEIIPDESVFKMEPSIKVDLFDKSGVLQSNVELYLDKPDENINVNLIEILENRIEKGVRNFFKLLEHNYKCKHQNWESVYIFLAGNSSKSPIIKKLFDEYIEKYSDEIGIEKEMFKVYAPLGTEEADKIQEENGVEVDKDCITRATGKTGVAYGLLDGRAGSKILVISDVKADEEIPFRFYIGLNRRNKFIPVMWQNSEYNKWMYFIDAYCSDFEIYYSNLPEVTSFEVSIKDIKKKKCILPKIFEDDTVGVYIRPVKPNSIEYAVATEDGIKNNEYLIEPVEIELG